MQDIHSQKLKTLEAQVLPYSVPDFNDDMMISLMVKE